ncbi:hypothetical protein [Candidatus Contubernalis alkaliaceticus]|uniref:hypothetical protein n=1 Tax=Candidatus Contubernalis alkaliaceticus TaxID=338645 RepID=UPI001F4C1FBB|nr:hypothetical protein [Candidatus Contubernalis alkalaceticus]UNC93243.1 hypothetical protein HUE98_14800 [Candidatus Contubernalis alkalaceticus]
MSKRLFKYYCSIGLTLFLFLGILYFAFNQVERNINQLAGIETPLQSFVLDLETGGLLRLTFGGETVRLSLPAIFKTCFYPGVLIHTTYLHEKI